MKTTSIIGLFFLFTSVQAQNWHFVDESNSRIPDVQCVGRWVDVGDINSDNSVDILVGCVPGVWPQGPGYEQLYYNNGMGYFILADSALFPQLDDYTNCVLLFDCDGDSNLDTYVVNSNYQTDYIAINNGDGVFAIDWSRLPADSAVGNIANYADIDGDGDIDICMLGNELTGDNVHRVWINDGNGYFTNQPYRLPQLNLIYSTIEFADIDGDLDTDLLVNDIWDPGQPRILINDGTGSFIDETNSRLPPADWSRICELVDLDNDNDFDIVLGYELRCGFFINDGLGFFTDETSQRGPLFPYPSSAPFDIKAADLDNDGDEDLAIGTNVSYNELAFINTGNGYFVDQTSQRMPLQGLDTNNLVLADVDGDGDVDLIRTGGGYARNSIYINTLNIPDSIAPHIKSAKVFPQFVQNQGPYTVKLSVKDGGALGYQLSASLFYSTDSLNYMEIELNYVGGYMFYGEIPTVDSGTMVYYYYFVEDKEGNVSLFPRDYPDSVLTFTYLPINTSINDSGFVSLPNEFKLDAYPNPFNSSITITTKNRKGGESKAEIFDVNGRLIRILSMRQVNNNEQIVNWDGTTRLNDKVPSGIYFVLARSTGVKKILKVTHIR